MKEHPILFSGAMVRALLAGTKTQTRRVVKPAPQTVRNHRSAAWDGDPAELIKLLTTAGRRCPYGQPGDRLWVRETWAKPDMRSAGFPPYVYAAEWTDADRPKHRWRPSIHMPRSASRITLEVTGVRVERLQDISEADALAEGIAQVVHDKLPVQQCGEYDGIDVDPVDLYRDLWESINGPGSWEANPWVWVIAFKRLEDAA